jgi:hypothetical protein
VQHSPRDNRRVYSKEQLYDEFAKKGPWFLLDLKPFTEFDLVDAIAAWSFVCWNIFFFADDLTVELFLESFSLLMT